MGAILSFLKSKIADSESALLAWLEKVGLTAGIGWGLSALKASHPDWPLPSEQFLHDLVIMLVSVHSARDAWEALKAAFSEYAAGRAQK